MKKCLTLFMIPFMFAFVAKGQWNDGQLCGTSLPSNDHLDYLERINADYDLGMERVSNNRINIPVKFHIVSDLSGNRYDYNTMLTVLCELNEQFKTAGMYFYMRGEVNNITSNVYFNHTSFNTGTQLMLEHNQARVINIYFVNLGQIGLCGYAYFPGSGPGNTLSQGGVMMSIPCSQAGNTTLAHELGHYFALPHTFDFTSNNPKDVFAERVTRNPNETLPRLSANCASQGDRFCDTPADYIGFRWNCNSFAINDSDINNDRFQPDASYFMSYSSDFCMNRFSNQQINVMRSTLATNQSSRGYLTVIPIPAWDSIPEPVSLIEPLAGNEPQPANWVFFRWRKAPGATRYFVRIRRNNLPITEFITTDTVHLYTLPLLQANLTYTYTVRPYNHAYTCVGPSQTGTFTTTTAYGTSVNDLKPSQIQVYPSLYENGQPFFIRHTEVQLKSMTVIDMQGRQMYSQALEGQGELQQIQLPSLPAAMYQVRIETEQGPVFRRLVVQ